MNAKKVFLSAALAWALYIALRQITVAFLPVTTLVSFVRQDLAVTLWRFLLFIALLALAQKAGAWPQLGFKRGPLLIPAAIGTLLIASQFPHLFPWANRVDPPLGFYLVELPINLMVGFNEEISFRGIFYNGLKETKGLAWAEYGSTAGFTLMHLGYQPLSGLPLVYLQGLVYCKLRSRGVPLPLLIAVHGLNDYLVISHLPAWFHDGPMTYIEAWGLTLLALGWALVWKPSPDWLKTKATEARS